ncbi:MAG: FtsQ-type POTRA domain-containing protein [Ignavibacteriota bacterium]|nr:FtsQ-type POTRA domain-containing protein [Ignavibacteriota bacterium]MBW7842386.1 FtsQ-type POTRA domain-containing protein [Ignavibacterium sp.]MCO6447449.1 cell division protein FtsQ/DivIB [Ignavibacterium album]MCZ2269262.1 FtsQ-type POTRA domain-containing protein [Ignavibacteriales bacterium]HMN17516.1 FtsQ-type POTRA domain-containing protein [Ignavibacteriaceae bacterium]
MKKDFGKLFSVILLSAIVALTAYLSLVTYSKKGKEDIKMINIFGNKLLNKDIYMQFANIDQLSVYDNISLNIIKKRIEEHPYIAKAEVKSDGRGNVDVRIKEKDIYAILLTKAEPFFVTNDFELLRIMQHTTYSDIPVISNFRLSEKPVPQKLFKTEDIVEAFKIIDAAKITDTNLAKRISEINLKNGGDVVLTFSGVNYPVVFGRGNESKKMIYLSLVWERINNLKAAYQNTEYIDLRFNNEAYIGSRENTGLI